MSAGTATAEPRRAGHRRADGQAGTAWRWTAALACTAAAGTHVLAAADHLTAGDLVVGFFVLVALAQTGAAAWLAAGAVSGLRMPREPLFLVATLAGTVALVVLYLVVHTTDLLDPLIGSAHDHRATDAGAAHSAHPAVTGPVSLDAEPPEVVEPPVLGTAAVAAELLVVGAVAALLPPSIRRWALDGLLALGALAWTLWLTGALG